MGGVFANGLEISGKATSGKTIAAFPDVCMTPPENPATPPGVPVPYPNFAMAGDTEKGTGTVFIEGETVNLKNKSDMSKTSGDEAGCAAKKGVVTSKNTGKSYFNSWSNDVKFDGEPVVRMSDLTTNNHASPGGNAPPWAHVLKVNMGNITCGKLLANAGMKLHAHKDSPCPTESHESEHFVRVTFFQSDRENNVSYDQWKNYDQNTAPCICMRAYKHKKGGGFQRGPGSKKDTPHNLKTNAVSDYIAKLDGQGKKPKLKGAMDKSIKATTDNHKGSKNAGPKTKENIGKCLKMIMMAYLQAVVVPAKTQTELNAMTTME